GNQVVAVVRLERADFHGTPIPESVHHRISACVQHGPIQGGNELKRNDVSIDGHHRSVDVTYTKGQWLQTLARARDACVSARFGYVMGKFELIAIATLTCSILL